MYRHFVFAYAQHQQHNVGNILGIHIEALHQHCIESHYTDKKMNELLKIATAHSNHEQSSIISTALVKIIRQEVQLNEPVGLTDYFESRMCLLGCAFAACKASTVDWQEFCPFLLSINTSLPDMNAWCLTIVASFQCKVVDAERWLVLLHDLFAKGDADSFDIFIDIVLKLARIDGNKLTHHVIVSSERTTRPYLWFLLTHYSSRNFSYAKKLLEQDSVLDMDEELSFICFLDYSELVVCRKDWKILLQRCLNELLPGIYPSPIVLGICRCFDYYPDLVIECFESIAATISAQHEHMNYAIGCSLYCLQRKVGKKQWQVLIHEISNREVSLLGIMSSISTLFPNFARIHNSYCNVQIHFQHE